MSERNHYFDFLKYLLFIFVVFIHNPFPDYMWGGVWTAVSRCAVPTYFAISGFFFRPKERNYNGMLIKARRFIGIYILFNIIWFMIYYLIANSAYGELAKWAKLEITFENVITCLLFGSAFGNEYLWYLHAIGFVYLILYICIKYHLFEQFYKLFSVLLLLYWLMAEGISIFIHRGIPSYLYRNWLFEGLGFFLCGYWLSKHKDRHSYLTSVLCIAVGFTLTVIEYFLFGRFEVYAGSFLIVFGLISLQDFIEMPDNFLSKCGREHSLHLYLFSPFVALLLILIHSIMIHTTIEQQGIITLLVIILTTILVHQKWFCKLVKNL